MASNKKPVIGLGLDPGATNFGWAIVAARSMEDYVLIEDGLLCSVSSQQKEVDQRYLIQIVDEIMSRVLLSDATFVSIERYHPRGGTLVAVEYVNQMIGAAMTSLAGLPSVQLATPTASAWKGIAYPKSEQWTYLDWFPSASVIHAGDAACQVLSMMYYKKLIPWE